MEMVLKILTRSLRQYVKACMIETVTLLVKMIFSVYFYFSRQASPPKDLTRKMTKLLQKVLKMLI